LRFRQLVSLSVEVASVVKVEEEVEKEVEACTPVAEEGRNVVEGREGGADLSSALP
jgi:hypothetical protein